MTTMKKKMNICETPIPECELDTYEAVAYEEQFTFDDLKNVLTSNEIKMLRQHFIEGYSIKEISIEILKEKNIKGLILDIDNTLIDYDK